jgi:hypothetical protein
MQVMHELRIYASRSDFAAEGELSIRKGERLLMLADPDDITGWARVALLSDATNTSGLVPLYLLEEVAADGMLLADYQPDAGLSGVQTGSAIWLVRGRGGGVNGTCEVVTSGGHRMSMPKMFIEWSDEIETLRTSPRAEACGIGEEEAKAAESAEVEEAEGSEEGLAKAQEGWGNEQREEEEEESAITIAAYYQEGAELANVRRLLQLANEELETAARARKKAEDMAKAAKAEAEATRARAEMERAKASVTLHRSKNPNMESSRIAARVVGETSTTVETAVEAPSARADARPSLQQGAPKSVWRQVREPVFAVALATQSFTPERHTSGLGVLT